MAFRTNKVPAIEERSVSGSSVSFNSAFALPLKACKVSFSATQAGSGEPSPSNPRAISGVSAIGLTANSTPISVNFGDTYYGGELDLLTGELTVTHTIVDMGAIEWVYTSSSGGYFTPRYTQDKANGITNIICEIYKTSSSSSVSAMEDLSIKGSASSSGIYVRDTNYTDGATFRQSVNGKYMAFQRKTPTIIQLSANELSSIIGNNTFSTDTGTLEITFADLQEKSASGSVASFNTALAMPLASCNIAVNAWQEGSGDPSPSNVRAIHGFSEVNAYQRAVNLWNEEWELGTYRSASGEPSSSNSNIRSKSTSYISVTPNTTYYFNTNGYTMNVYQYASDKSYIGYFSVTNQSRQVDVNCYYLRFYIWSNYGTTYKNDISINYPSTDTDYHAYTGNTYTIQLGQEVYGAEVDVVNGVAHVTHKLSTIPTITSFNEIAGVRYSSYRPSDISYVSSITNDIICEVGYGRGYNKNFSVFHNSYNIFHTVDGDYTVEDYNANIAGHYDIYPLATPITVQLTPTQIETIAGKTNTIFADTGDVDLTYKDLDIAKRGNFREVFKLPS